MPKYALKVEYDGSPYSGWQSQECGQTVQDYVESAIEQVFQERPRLNVAGRTDAGVHAYGQVSDFVAEKILEPFQIIKALNFYLMEEKIRIIDAAPVEDPDFHARFSAVHRDYIYQIYNRPVESAHLSKLTYHIPYDLNVDKMNEAAQSFVGHHDFSSFRAQGCQSNSPEKTLDQFDVWQEHDVIYFYVKSKSFLYRQVRNMVGTLVNVGKGKWPVEKIVELLELKDRTQSGPTAPAHGLYFKSVGYQNSPFKS